MGFGLLFLAVGVFAFLFSNITANESVKKSESNVALVVLDARPFDIYKVEHVETAMNVDYRSTLFDYYLSVLSKDNNYIVYASDEEETVEVVAMFKEAGFKVENGVDMLATSEKLDLPVIKGSVEVGNIGPALPDPNATVDILKVDE